MFIDAFDIMLTRKIYEANELSQDISKATFEGLVDAVSQSSKYKYVDKKVIIAEVERNLHKLINYDIVDSKFVIDEDDAIRRQYYTNSGFERLVERWYRENITHIKGNLNASHFGLLDEIINKEDFCIKGQNVGATQARTGLALDLSKYDLVRFDIEDTAFAYPMATVLGGVINNDYLCGYVPGERSSSREMERA